jgi:beta-lactamase superfamily II metal-dependent hydrolase
MPLHLDILDVGQGDGMVVWLPNGKVMMVDYGSTKNKGLVSDHSFKYFRDHTPFKNPGQSLEWLVLTHGDRDHYNMVEAFLQQFSVNVRNVLHGGLENEYGGLINRLRNRNPDRTSTTVVTGTDRGFFPLATTAALGAEVMVLAIGVRTMNSNAGYVKNTRSVVLRIVYQNVGMILAGDATRDTELQLINVLKNNGKDPRQELAAHVLKVAHHGSHRTSNNAVWIKCVRPNYAFISSDRSGALDDDQKPTGHRLPQALTIELLRTYANLAQDRPSHSYVVSYQRSDFEEYNAHPEFTGQPMPFPTFSGHKIWEQVDTTEGIYSTLSRMGTSNDPSDEGAADVGVQYRVTIGDNGSLDVLTTDYDDDEDMDTRT